MVQRLTRQAMSVKRNIEAP